MLSRGRPNADNFTKIVKQQARNGERAQTFTFLQIIFIVRDHLENDMSKISKLFKFLSNSKLLCS